MSRKFEFCLQDCENKGAVQPSDIYGSAHLLRLMVKLGTYLSFANYSEASNKVREGAKKNLEFSRSLADPPPPLEIWNPNLFSDPPPLPIHLLLLLNGLLLDTVDLLETVSVIHQD